ncbi:MAG: cytochrome b [Rhodospirillaceae bacterium]|jgi:cytochrome b561|nr:cytochrome b [Rhodospirillaceae bacterium]MBT5566117.1 cytochrome b [Rhodospirillaceae bacterium]MBT6090626.1 cytochrome b [Rhodospirillaceae bacterium]MBT7449870.1 cytochrome b [Rhodospirillaceae bacterium]
MPLSNSADGWGAVSKVLHWLAAGIILAQFVTGFLRYFKIVSADTWALFYSYWHMPAGIVVLALVFFRLAWRFSQPHPELPEHMRWWERLAANGAHVYLYTAMVFMPLTGWAGFNALKIEVNPFGVNLPHLFWDIRPVSFVMADIHLYIAFGLVLVLLLHVIGALKHHIVDRDDTLRRMMPKGWLKAD